MGSPRRTVRRPTSKSLGSRRPPSKRAKRERISSPKLGASQATRMVIIWTILLIAVLGLLGRLVRLQLVRGGTLAAIAQQQEIHPVMPAVSRRSIVDRQGTLLAVDRLVYTLYAHPVLFRQPVGVIAQTLSPLLDTPAETLTQQLKVQDTGIRVQDELPEEMANRLKQLRLDGLELLPTHQRFYPQQELFAQIVGFVNLDGNAQTGLEAQYQEQLQLDRPARANQSFEAPLPVTLQPDSEVLTLQLTVDHHLQRVAQEALHQTLRQVGAKRGTVMVMDVNTGALRAFAVAPTFDPNNYFEADLSWLKNWAVTDVFEPGSTFKSVNMAIALETKAVTPTDTVYDEGRIVLDDWTIQNADYDETGRSGTMTLTDVLKDSSNVGMVRIMEQLPAAEFYQWLKTLEIDQPTGIELPAENVLPLKARTQFINSPVDVATAAFGQGLVLTPIKLLQLQAAIANGGKLVTPHVLTGLIDDTGASQWQPLRPAPRHVFSEETTQVVLEMMEVVVDEGTGQAAQIPGYRIAGKTGTAQKVTDSGSYGEERVVSFVSLLPVEAPRFVVLSIIDEPSGPDATGGSVAAPLTKTIMESLLVLEGIPPSSPQALGGVSLP